MSSPAELEVLSHVGPGTPLGNLLRRYWLPLVFDWEVPEPELRSSISPRPGRRPGRIS